MEELLRINVGGFRFGLLRSSVIAYPETRLGKLAIFLRNQLPRDATNSDQIKRCNEPVEKGICSLYLNEDEGWYFNRAPSYFSLIMNFYQLGVIHKPEGMCQQAFYDELEYWGIASLVLKHLCEECAFEMRMAIMEEFAASNHPLGLSQMSLSSSDEAGSNPDEIQVVTNPTCLQRLRENTWFVLERSDDSKRGYTFKVTSILFILVNTVIIVMDSIPNLHWSGSVSQELLDDQQYVESMSVTAYVSLHSAYTLRPSGTGGSNSSSPPGVGTFLVDDYDPTNDNILLTSLRVIDMICTAWFTFEFLIRFWSSPNRLRFMQRILSVIDLLAVLPFYLELMARCFMEESSEAHRIRLSFRSLRIFRAFRALRIFRVLKLVRYESNFKVLARCLYKSLPEMLLLAVYLFIATFVFGTLLYYAELDETESGYKTIPLGAWYSITTYFGYAAEPPRSIPGKLISAVGAVCGLILLAIVGLLIGNFIHTYKKTKKRKIIKENSLKRAPSGRKLERYSSRMRRRATVVTSNPWSGGVHAIEENGTLYIGRRRATIHNLATQSSVDGFRKPSPSQMFINRQVSCRSGIV